MIRKTLAIVFALTLTFCAFLFIYASDEKETPDKLLSELSFEEQVAFVERNGIDWPPNMNAENFRESLPLLIEHVERDPNYPVVYNYYESLLFGEKVKKAVNDYYHRTQTNDSSKSELYNLVDSTVTGS